MHLRHGNRWRAIAALLAAMIVGGLGVAVAPAAEAATDGTGYGQGVVGGFLGAYVAESDGRNVYCTDLALPAATAAASSGPTTVGSLAGVSDFDLARLNYVLSAWGQSGDPHVTAAVALFVWSITSTDLYDTHPGISGDNFYVARAPSGDRPAILANLATMRSESSANASTSASASMSISMNDLYDGVLTVSISPASLTGTVSLTDATFADGSASKAVGAGTYPIVGTPADGARSYHVSAHFDSAASGAGSRVDYYTTPGAQSLIAGAQSPVAADTQSPEIPLIFQPTLATTVGTKFLPAGETFVDELDVGVSDGSWVRLSTGPVAVTATGVLYGPFDQQPDEADAPPADAPVAGQETVTLPGPGHYDSPGTVVASSSGFYTWVWTIDKTTQGEVAQYLEDGVRTDFGQGEETAIVPFQPVATSQVSDRLLTPGDMETDTLQVSTVGGPWLRRDDTVHLNAEGDDTSPAPYIPMVFTGHVYEVAGDLPPTAGSDVPADATLLATVQVTAAGPGSYTSPPVALLDPGFVVWVWSVDKADQPVDVQPYLAADWSDSWAEASETTSVRPPITVTSLLREYNVDAGGRAFDTITVNGFQDDHGTFDGDGTWRADDPSIVNTVYGPFATDTALTGSVDLSSAPVLTRISTPARSGTYQLGYTGADEIVPTEPGFYVVVSSFAGDDRVQPGATSIGDVLERFHVAPPTGQTPPPATTPGGGSHPQALAMTGTNDPTPLVTVAPALVLAGLLGLAVSFVIRRSRRERDSDKDRGDGE